MNLPAKAGQVVERDGETERKILDAAHAVFVRRGTAGARTQEIADEAGVNKALLHYYFRSKEGLAEAVFRRAIGTMMPVIFAVIGSELPIEEKVRTIVDRQLTFLSGHPYLPGYVIGELTHRPERMQKIFAERGPPPLDRLAAQIDEGVAAGTLRPITAQELVVNLMSLIFFPFAARPMLEVVLGMGGGAFDDFLQARRARLVDFYLNAIRP